MTCRQRMPFIERLNSVSRPEQPSLMNNNTANSGFYEYCWLQNTSITILGSFLKILDLQSTFLATITPIWTESRP
jgi:hypothetical protein